MRISEKVFNITEQITTEKEAANEDIRTIVENKGRRLIELGIAYYDATGSTITTETVLINKDNYELLMSESPDFAPGKPANEYREVDLWYMVDKITEGV